MHSPTILHRWKFLPVLSIGVLVASFSYTVFAAYDTDGLVGYWKLDETSGTAVYDSSGHNQTGTATGTPTISSTIPTLNFTNARSRNFDGSSDYVTMGDVANLEVEGSTPFSISVWFNPNSSPGAESTYALIAKGTPSVAGYAFQYEQVSSEYQINLSKYGVEDQRVSISQLTSGTWYHLVAVQRSSEVEYYINGTSQGTYSNASSYNASGTNDFRIGAASNDSLYADGLIDDVRVYSRELSAIEITDLAAGKHTTAEWDGSSSTDFETAANWNINAIPDPYTHIIVPETIGGAELTKPASGASITIEASGFTGSYVDLHGFDFELVDGGTLKGGGTLRLLGSENISNIANLATVSTGALLYYGTGSYTGLAAGDSYYNLNINDGLVGYWDMDASEGGYVRDVSGYDADGVRGTLTAAPTFVSTTPPTAFFNRYALSFDGGDKVDLNNASPFRKSQYAGTASVWVKTDNVSSDQIIFWTEENRDRGLVIDGDDSAFAGMQFDANISGMRVASGGTVTTGWHHVAYTWNLNQGAVRLFVDGVLVDSSIGSASTTNSNDNRSGIGEYVGAGDFTNDYNNFDGLIDDFRIYDRVLQNHEISALAAGHMPATASGAFTLDANLAIANDLVLAAGNLDVSGSNKAVILSGSWLNYGGVFTPRVGAVTLEGFSGTEELRSGGQEFSQLNIDGSSTWTLRDDLEASASIRLNSNAGTLDASTNSYAMKTGFINQSAGTITPRSGIVVLNATASKTATITSTLNELQIEDPTEDGLLAYWKFDECQTDSTEDSSGNSQTGTLNGPALWTGSNLPSTAFDNQCALSFDGSDNQFVESASNSTLTGNATFSVALWFYVPTGANTDGTYGRFIDWGNAASGESAQMSVYSSTINQLFVGHWATGQASTTTFSNDEWHHAVWVRTGGSNNGHQGNKLYLDGVEIPLDINISTAKTINVAADTYDIGGRGTGNLSVECKLDDVRIYNRALSELEIRNLANGQYASGQSATTQFSLGADLDLDTLTILSGKLSPLTRTIDISGDWNNYAGSGAFIEGTSIVDFDGSSTQNIRGSTEFYNLEVSTASTQTVKFGSGTTQYISNALTLAGAASNLLTLDPLTAGIEWFIDLAGSATQSISYVNPSYSNASLGEELDPCPGSTDGGSNTNWSFPCASVSSSSGNGGWNTNKQRLNQAGGGGDNTVAQNDTESPDLQSVGIADEITEVVKNAVGGILTAAMRTPYQAELSRRAKEITAALAERFTKGIYEYRLAQQQSEDSLKASAPQLDDAMRRMMRAERNVADHSISKLTASAIGEKRGLLVAVVKSEQVVFADVPVDAWYAPFVSSVIEENIATGYEDETGKPTGEFGVTNPVTLAEVLKMALQSADIKLDAGSPRNTSAQGTWASAYIAKGEELNLDVYRPERNVHENATRAEVVHTILQVLGLPVAPNGTSPFTDLPESHPYQKSLSTAYLYGIVTGDTDADGNLLGTIRPDDTINRAEVAKTIALIKDLFDQ